MFSVYCLAFCTPLVVTSQRDGKELEFPNGKPGEVPVQLWNDHFPFIAIEKKAPLCAYITVKHAPVFADPAGVHKIGTATFPQANKGFPFHVGDVAKSNGLTYVLLVEKEVPASATNLKIKQNADGYYGWVATENVTVFPHSDEQPILFALEDKNSSISRKAMLINKLPENKGDFSELLGNVQFLDQPNASGKKNTQRSLFSIYYIVDVFPKSAEPGKEEYLLLAATRETKPGKEAQILGWVRKNRLVEWNTRECLEPYRNAEQSAALPPERKRPGLYFKSRADVQAYVEFIRGKEKKAGDPEFEKELAAFLQNKLISREEIGNANWSWTYPMARFPILENATLPTPLADHRVYRVGVIGDVYTNDGAVVLQARRSDLLRHEIEKLKAASQIIQVKFVLDATFGMDPWFKTGAMAVEKIIQEVQGIKADGLQVQFSVNFYRDRREVEGGPVFQGFDFMTGQAAINLLRNAKAVGGWDDPDAVYLGLERAISDPGDKRRFAADAIKVLIVVGDDGNNEDAVALQALEKLIETEGRSSPVNFFAVAVGDQEIPRYQDFPRQMKQLCAGLNQAERVKRQKSIEKSGLPDREKKAALRQLERFSVAQFLQDRDGNKVSRSIEEKFRDAVKEMRLKTEEFTKVISGAVENSSVPVEAGDPVAGAYRMAWRDQVLNSLKEKGFEPLLLAQKGVQLFQEAWVLEVDPLEEVVKNTAPPCVRFMWYVDKPDFIALHKYVTNVVAGKEWDQGKVQEIWIQALNGTVAGDLVKKTSRAELLKQNELGTPEKIFRKVFKGIQVRSSILKMDFNEIATSSANDVRREYQQLNTSLQRMDAVSKDRSFRFSDQGNDAFRVGQPTQYWYATDQGQLKAWLDRQIFP